MAIANSDGSITLDVKVNKSELENALKEMKSSIKGIGSLNKSISSTTALLGKMATALGVVFGVREIIRFSNEASNLAAQTEANVKRLSMLYGEAAQSVYDFANDNAYAFGMAKSAAYDAAADYGNIFTTFADGAQSAKLTNEMLQATAVIASQTGRTYEDVFEKIRSGLYGNTRAIDDLGLSVRQSSLMQTKAYAEVSKNGTRAWNSLTDAELQQARALGIIEQAQAKYGNTVMQSTALTRSQFNAAWTDFKATWGQAVNLVLIPILQVATQILNTVTAVMQKIFHLTGKQLDTSSKISSSIGSAAENQDKLTDSIKGTNKELKKELASFDELEILSRDTASNTSSGSGGGVSTVGGDMGGGLGGEAIVNQGEIDAKLAAIVGLTGAALVGLGILLLFTGGKKLLALGMIATGALTVWTAAEMVELTTEEEKKKLAKLFAIVGVVAFNLGVLLLFTKKWKWGLGLMGMGIADVVGALAMGDFEGDVKTLVSEILLIEGLVAFLLGVICLFIPKCWKYGIALMGIGVAEVIGASALGGEELKTALQQFCTQYWEVLYAIGIIMCVVGIVLLFVNPKALWKYAITLILVGITDLVATTLLGGDTLKQELQTFCTQYWKILYGIGIIMVCVGIVVLFTGKWAIGLTLIGVGIADLVATTKFGGDTLKQEVTNFCDKYWLEMKVIGIIMCVVGIILLFTPVWAVGLAMIGLGYTSINMASAFSSADVEAQYLEQIEGFKKWLVGLSVAMFVIGCILLFVPGAMGVGLALMGTGATGLFAASSLDNTAVKKSVKSGLSDVQKTAKQGVNDINAEYAKIGQTAPSSVNVSTNGTVTTKAVTQSIVGQSVSFQIPALARGAVIPANREFLAVLGDQKHGTNVEAPAELIKQMAKEAYQEMGLANNQQQQIIKEEHYNLNQTELMTIMYKLVKGGERLNGTSLVKQGGI